MSKNTRRVVIPFRQTGDDAAPDHPASPVDAFYGAAAPTPSAEPAEGFFAVNFDMVRSSAIAAASSDLFPDVGARLFEAGVRDLTARACEGLWAELHGPAVFLGDGGLCAFTGARAAHSYAEALHDLSVARNERVVDPERWWRFRIGIGGLEAETDDFEFRVRDRASVLELNAAPGGTVIDEHVYCSLPPSLRRLYCGQETIEGKRSYVGHRRAAD